MRPLVLFLSFFQLFSSSFLLDTNCSPCVQSQCCVGHVIVMIQWKRKIVKNLNVWLLQMCTTTGALQEMAMEKKMRKLSLRVLSSCEWQLDRVCVWVFFCVCVFFCREKKELSKEGIVDFCACVLRMYEYFFLVWPSCTFVPPPPHFRGSSPSKH